jgi:hypothetical protein
MRLIIGAFLLVIGFVIGKADIEKIAWNKLHKSTEKTVDNVEKKFKNLVTGKDTSKTNKKDNDK